MLNQSSEEKMRCQNPAPGQSHKCFQSAYTVPVAAPVVLGKYLGDLEDQGWEQNRSQLGIIVATSKFYSA